jgi:hypothetical protein
MQIGDFVGNLVEVAIAEVQVRGTGSLVFGDEPSGEIGHFGVRRHAFSHSERQEG